MTDPRSQMAQELWSALRLPAVPVSPQAGWQALIEVLPGILIAQEHQEIVDRALHLEYQLSRGPQMGDDK